MITISGKHDRPLIMPGSCISQSGLDLLKARKLMEVPSISKEIEPYILEKHGVKIAIYPMSWYKDSKVVLKGSDKSFLGHFRHLLHEK